jgi:hypothetical protein
MFTRMIISGVCLILGFSLLAVDMARSALIRVKIGSTMSLVSCELSL